MKKLIIRAMSMALVALIIMAVCVVSVCAANTKTLTISSRFSDWKLESFNIDLDGNTYFAEMNQRCDINESISYTFRY